MNYLRFRSKSLRTTSEALLESSILNIQLSSHCQSYTGKKNFVLIRIHWIFNSPLIVNQIQVKWLYFKMNIFFDTPCMVKVKGVNKLFVEGGIVPDHLLIIKKLLVSWIQTSKRSVGGYLPNFAILFLFFKKFLLIWILSEKWKWKVPFLSEI